MLVQEYLAENGIEALKEEKKIIVTEHESLPLTILNYNQLYSPKTDPVARECRGLVLHKESYELVARSFSRFFNWGEVTEEMDLFCWDNFIGQEKVDGSLVLLWYWEGRWMCSTRGSFADGRMESGSMTWRACVKRALGVGDLQEADRFLNRNLTFVCELCSQWNKVVRQYYDPQLFLLAAFHGETEIPIEHLMDLPSGLSPVRRFAFSGIEDIQAHIAEAADKDGTYEGVVIRDRNLMRWKVKSPKYLSLHRLKNNGNLFAPKNLLPFVLRNDQDELLSYFPEAREGVDKVRDVLLEEYEALEAAYAAGYGVREQKQFAQAILPKTKVPAILFNLRKRHGPEFTKESLLEEWSKSEELLVKVLFKS